MGAFGAALIAKERCDGQPSSMLSPYSDRTVFRMGMDSIPSESECYPAKLVHGHIEWLVSRGVDTIFYPCVYYEREERDSQQNYFNCPMVISYPENIRNNVDSLAENNVRYLCPFISFANEEILLQSLCEFMKKEYGIKKSEVEGAVHAAWEEQLKYKQDVLEEGRRALVWMEANHAKGIVLAGRPYHLDPEINHGIPEMIHSFGLAVLTEDSIAGMSGRSLVLRATNQWTYHSRLYAAAEFVSHREDLEMVQLNSFGCGLDAITIDQVQDLLTQSGRMYTLLKIDEVSNLGAARIRVRSLLAAMKMKEKEPAFGRYREIKDFSRLEFTQDMHDENYTIICTEMVPYHFELIEAVMRSCGYNLVMLRGENQRSIDLGLKYVNNVVCAQPFGCLPNHIAGKGIMKKVKDLYPQANIVAIDYDPSASRVNLAVNIEIQKQNLMFLRCQRDCFLAMDQLADERMMLLYRKKGPGILPLPGP